MTNDQNEAARVMDALQAIVDRIDSMMDDAANAISSSSDLSDRLVALKADIKSSAKRGKVEDDHYAQTDIERCYYDPALREASARFMLRTNTSPSSHVWERGLGTVRGEIDYYLDQLRRQYPEV